MCVFREGRALGCLDDPNSKYNTALSIAASHVYFEMVQEPFVFCFAVGASPYKWVGVGGGVGLLDLIRFRYETYWKVNLICCDSVHLLSYSLRWM